VKSYYTILLLLCCFNIVAAADTSTGRDTIISGTVTLKEYAITDLSGSIDVGGNRLQPGSINLYCGKWQWVSGNRDTFTMIIKPVKIKTDKNGRAIQADFFGYHTYIEKGQLVESSMQAADDSVITNHTTLSGYVYSDKIVFVLYDITRDNRITYLLQLIDKRTDIGWLTYGGMNHRWVTDENKKAIRPAKPFLLILY